MLLGIQNGDFDLVNLLDDPASLGSVPKRCEFWRRRLECFLEMHPVSHQHASDRHSVGPGAIRVGMARRTGAEACTAFAIAKEFRFPLV